MTAVLSVYSKCAQRVSQKQNWKFRTLSCRLFNVDRLDAHHHFSCESMPIQFIHDENVLSYLKSKKKPTATE